MAHTLYTLGYSGLAPTDLLRIVELTGATLVDVRLCARSMNPQWRGAAIRTLVGERRYMHIRELGNLNYKIEGAEIELAAPEAAVIPMLAALAEGPAILLCGCADHHTCHRTVAAAWLAERLPDLVGEVQHLTNTGQLAMSL